MRQIPIPEPRIVNVDVPLETLADVSVHADEFVHDREEDREHYLEGQVAKPETFGDSITDSNEIVDYLSQEGVISAKVNRQEGYLKIENEVEGSINHLLESRTLVLVAENLVGRFHDRTAPFQE